ncbi:MAG: DoxX family protein [Chitinophagales bacterium]|nr:DoxX family protein [Chitinophagales bacterium]MDW8428246.1 DoxX family protein [Chitinophagales bacterium]
MNLIKRIEEWGDRHHPKWLDLLRILLGLIILGKGYVFISNTEGVKQIIENSRFGQVSFWLAHYVVFAHLIGGAMIALGLLTRLAILFQLPILIGAVVFVNAKTGFFSANSTELWFSIMVLFLLLFFLVEGSGPWSMDAYMKSHPEKDDWEEELKKA